jgi:hypothetical protein
MLWNHYYLLLKDIMNLLILIAQKKIILNFLMCVLQYFLSQLHSLTIQGVLILLTLNFKIVKPGLLWLILLLPLFIPLLWCVTYHVGIDLLIVDYGLICGGLTLQYLFLNFI